MSDLKSKLPDLKEITSIASKLFKDVKQSVSEIIDDYKKKREETEAEEQAKAAAENNEVVVGKAKTAEHVTEEPTATPAPKKPKVTVKNTDPTEPPKEG